MDYKDFEENKLKCRACDVGKVYNCVVPSDGNKINPTVLIIGECPGADELVAGKPFIGKAGKLLRSTLNKFGYNENNSIITNTIPCRPCDNQFPKEVQLINSCMEKWLFQEIEILKPQYILLIGATPTKYLLKKKTGISLLRGQWFEFKNIPCVSTYHSSYVLRKQYMQEGKEIREDFEADIKCMAEKACFI